MQIVGHAQGRVTASNLKASVRTSSDKPSVSLVKKLCYPAANRFTSATTAWGCQHESDAAEEFLDSFALDHVGITFEQTGLFINENYPFVGASPDGIIQCSCH